MSALVASFLGWTLDAFDFFLVVVALPSIAKDFGVENGDVAFAVSLTLWLRPVGAFLFGLLADRYGRRLPLMVDLVFFSIVEVLCGLTHSFTTFLILRALFGIGMGAEWGVGASLAMEKVPARWRGILSGFLQEGYAVGHLLAAVCSYFVFPRWGWRPMFFIGGLPALLALFVRVHVKESEVWEKTKTASWSHLWSGILAQWRLFLYLTLLMTTMNLVSHGTQDAYPTFLVQRGLGSREKDLILIVSMVGAVLGGILFGHVSDRVGRKRSMVIALLLACVMVPLWVYAPSTPLLFLGAFSLQFMVQGAWGVIPAHITELSPDAVRGFLPGFAYQCGVLFAGGVGWVQVLFARHLSFASTMALTALIVFLLAAAATAAGPERTARAFAEDENA